MSGVHSKIGASSMYRWSACPGSVKLSANLPQQQSSYAEEGTEAHEVAARLLADLSAKRPIPWVLDIDKDTYEAVRLYVDAVLSDSGTHPILIEEKFDLSVIHPGCFGTADAVVYDPDARLLRVYDYKHGEGILVEVEDNPQLKYYGLGALISTGFPCKEVELVIVQPRAAHVNGPVRRWKFDAFDLVEFAADLSDYAKATDDPKAPLKSGNHCRFCPAAGICPELSKQALTIAATEFSPTLSYDPATLADTLKKVSVLERYAKSVREFAYSEALQGRCPPGFKLVNKRATRQWKDRVGSTELAAQFDLSLDEIYDKPELKSPAQIEKIISKEDKKKLNEFTVSISSGTVLVEETDPRQPALPDAASEFTKIEEHIWT